jgi:hypothetical protein
MTFGRFTRRDIRVKAECGRAVSTIQQRFIPGGLYLYGYNDLRAVLRGRHPSISRMRHSNATFSPPVTMTFGRFTRRDIRVKAECGRAISNDTQPIDYRSMLWEKAVFTALTIGISCKTSFSCYRFYFAKLVLPLIAKRIKQVTAKIFLLRSVFYTSSLWRSFACQHTDIARKNSFTRERHFTEHSQT